ncbi:MAG: glycosyltransferase family 9 protein [Thiohalomonadaceae bacterium]
MKLLVARTDKLGDFMLIWPALALLKASLPQAEVHLLAREYTRPMAELCPWTDKVILLPENTGYLRWRALVQHLRSHNYDAIITLFSTTTIATAALAAGISYRLAPATKLAQVFYNRRLTQRRSRSEKPEWEYNVDMVRRFLADQAVVEAPLPAPPYLHFPVDEIAALRRQFCTDHGIGTDSRLVLIHPGSGGSASNLSVEQYATLATALHSQKPLHFVIGCGPGEEFKAEALAALLGELPHTILRAGGLADYARHIACADLFISGSTGPLHIAGALDVPTAAFYPRRRSATPLRWQTLNSPERRLAFTPPEEAGETDMSSIDVVAAAQAISDQFLADQ